MKKDCIFSSIIYEINLCPLPHHFSPLCISETLYGWIVVFVLPINSALNPILYTISTTPFVMWFMRSIKRGKWPTTRCYMGRKIDMSEARGSFPQFLFHLLLLLLHAHVLFRSGVYTITNIDVVRLSLQSSHTNI